MASWKFLDYIDVTGQNLIAEWYRQQDAKVRAQFDATLLLLCGTEDWAAPHVDEFKVLTGVHRGLGEIRFHVVVQTRGAKTQRRRFRPVGPWPPNGYDFVILLGCEKWGNVYWPPDAFGRALKLAQQLKDGKGDTRERV